jgi:hypothetical protein
MPPDADARRIFSGSSRRQVDIQDNLKLSYPFEDEF